MNNDELKTKETKKKKGGFLKGFCIALCIVTALALIVFGAYHAILNYYLDKINIVTEEEELSFETQRLTEEIPEETQTAEATETVTEEEEIDLHGTFGTGNLPLICDTKKVTNILLLATDTRQKGGAGRSDTMILVSINEENGKIVLCSFLRDLYAKYPKEPKNPIKRFFVHLLNPVFISMTIGLALGAVGAKHWMPPLIINFVGDLSSCFVPLSLLLTGYAIADYPLGEVFNRPKSYIFTLLRLIIIPAFALVITWLLGGNLFMATLVVLTFSCPSGMNVVVFPASYGQDCKTGARIVLLSCLGSVITVPILYALVQQLFG